MITKKDEYVMFFVCPCCKSFQRRFSQNKTIKVNCFTKGKIEINGMYDIPPCNNPTCEWSKAK